MDKKGIWDDPPNEHRGSCDASDAGMAPGYWPPFFTINDANGNPVTLRRRYKILSHGETGEFVGWEYVGETAALRIFND